MCAGFTSGQSCILCFVFLFSSFTFASTERMYGADKKIGVTILSIAASDLDHSVSAGDTEIAYVVDWDQPIREEIRVAFTHSEDTSSGLGFTSQSDAGLNICSPRDGKAVYGFFKNGIVAVDFKQKKLNLIAASAIHSSLSYLGRFEISELRDASHAGKVRFVPPPDTGSGPKNPCAFSKEET